MNALRQPAPTCAELQNELTPELAPIGPERPEDN
jgi:hypothetical protein